ncbi:MAG: HD domain-containing phosphohydrolase [Eubacteriales bacterium]
MSENTDPGESLPRGKNSRTILEDLMFKTIMKYSQDSIYFKDRDCRFIVVNNIKAEKHGVSDPDQMVGKTDFDYFSEDIAREINESEKIIMTTGQPVIGKIEKLTRLDGRTTWSSSSKHPLYDNSGELLGIWGISRDITESELSKEALIAAEIKLETIVANISDVITVTDITGTIKYMSLNLEKQFGWTTKELMGMNSVDYIHPDDRESIIAAYLDLVKNQMPFTSECRYRRKDGSYIPVKVSAVNMLDDPAVNGVLINYHDISERRKREEKIFYLSYHDVLTGLYNRAFFAEECIRLNTRRMLPISIIMGDVNGLKLTNDAFGHDEGDKLIKEVADILRLCCRNEDVIARIGGDEFSILLPQTTDEEAKEICGRIYAACAKYKDDMVRKSYYPSISLGHATKTELHVSIDSLQKEAEDFMYRRKLLEQKSMHSSLISSIRATMNERSHETEEHSERMIHLSVAVGKILQLSDEQLFELDLLSRLHDIGKISIEEYILSKPGKLTTNEWSKVKLHPEVGCRIAQSSPDLIGIAYYILCHHERWDGNGYPQNLSGENIPLLSRIISIVDSYDAMTQDRPYRKAMSKNEAIDEIRAQSGVQFDPELARVFVEDVLGISWK